MSTSTPVDIRLIGPVAGGVTAWRYQGQLRVTAIVKAAFWFAPEAAMGPAPPEEIHFADVHYNGDRRRSLWAASDLVPYRPRADVVLTGHARFRAEDFLLAGSARFAVIGEEPVLDKTIQLIGDRSTGSTSPLGLVPLVYERAFGGDGWNDNPVGTGSAAGTAPPNLVDPANPRQTVGFGPLASAWPARDRLLREVDRRGLGQPITEIPDDFDWNYFQCAPADQRTDFLLGDEWILLDNLHPTLPRARSRLPGAQGLGRVYGLRRPNDVEPIALNADDLHIDADRGRCTITWRGSFAVPSPEALSGITVMVAVEMGGQPVAWPDPAARTGPRARLPPSGGPTITLGDAVPALGGPTMPFIPGSPAADLFERPREAVNESGSEALRSLTKSFPIEMASPVDLRFAASSPPGSPLESTLVLPPEQAARGPISLTMPFEKPAAPVADEEGLLDTIKTTLPTPAAPAAPAGTPAAPRAPLREARQDSPLEGTLVLSDVQRSEVAPRASLPFAATTPVPEPSAAALPVEPAVSAARFFHRIAPREEQTSAAELPPELPKRKGLAVPIVYETDARRGPLVAFTMPWQMKPPRDSLTIAIKATCDLVAGGAARVRPESDFPNGDVYFGNDPRQSLLHASDFTPYKPRADVTLTGTAYAPGGSAARSEVRFRFGQFALEEMGPAGAGRAAGNDAMGKPGIDRKIAVFGERRWERTWSSAKPSEPLPFEAIPVRYENAFGGPGHAPNPVGVGLAAKGADVVRLPSLEDPAHLLVSPTEMPAPACFAPIPPLWKERWSLGGTHDARWAQERWPYYPADVDLRIAQSAPAVQQLETIHGDESFVITGMHRALPVVAGTLPKLRARCFAQRTAEAGGELTEIPIRLDTASFDLDAMALALVWRGLLEVSADDAPEIAAFFVFTEEMAAPAATLSEARSRLFAALRRREQAPPAPATDAVAAIFSAEQEKAEERARENATKDREKEERAAKENDRVRERMRAQGISDEEITRLLATDGGAAGGAPPPRPDPKEIADRLRSAGVSEAEIASMLATIAEAAGPRAPTPEEQAARARRLESARQRVIRMLAAQERLDGLDLSGADLSELDFTGRSLCAVNLKDASLRGSKLTGANLTQAQMSRADLSGAALDGANLTLADLTASNVAGASFAGASLAQTDLSRAHGAGAIFRGAKGRGARFSGGEWVSASFEEMAIEAADFSEARLDRAVFDRAVLPQVRLHQAHGKNVSFRDATIPGARADGTRFSESSFRSVSAPGSIWNKAMLDEVNFYGATLGRASFFGASCERANLSAADLVEARFDRARLSGATFLKSNLMNASLQQADLSGADLRGANLYGCNTWKATLTGAHLELANLDKSTLKGIAGADGKPGKTPTRS